MRGTRALCIVCGRTTLMVPGYTAHLPPAWWFVSRWDDPAEILHGEVHFACLRTASFGPDFAAELISLRAMAPHSVTVRLRDAPEPVTIERDSAIYDPEPLLSGAACRVFATPDRARFLVVEHTGPFHTVDPYAAVSLAQGQPVFHTYADMAVTLPEAAADALTEGPLGFSELVERLGVADCYPGAAGVELGGYRYIPGRRRLEYSARAPLPIPAEAAEAIREVAAASESAPFHDEFA